jgi:hypothetical protein
MQNRLAFPLVFTYSNAGIIVGADVHVNAPQVDLYGMKIKLNLTEFW